MKNLLLAASAVALLAATGCSDKKGGSVAMSGADTVTTAASASVAYFNIDSLISKYDMYTDLRSAYEEKAKKADAELTSKGRALERGVRDYQEKVQNGLVTRAQAQGIEENLNRQQQAFVQHRDQVMGEMAEEEQVLLNQIHFSITEYPGYSNLHNQARTIKSFRRPAARSTMPIPNSTSPRFCSKD